MRKAGRDVLGGLRKEFDFSRADMMKMMIHFHLEMSGGLAGRPSSLKMLPAYVDRPTGNETGEFLALDLGGTNFRVLRLRLRGRGRITGLEVRKFAIPKRVMTGDGKKLFSFLASSIKKFLRAERLCAGCASYNLGFTFSFPMKQRGIAGGSLVVWTKGFASRGVVGRDVVALLKEALVLEGLAGIRVSALANDTVGTLMARAYSDRDCDVGVIIGTGTNACYVEAVKNIKKLKKLAMSHRRMIINIEWGNFNKLRPTRYDRQLDRASDNPGSQILEKMVSGMYLGEVARLAISDAILRDAFSENIGRTTAGEPYSLQSKDVSITEGDASSGLVKVGALLRDLGAKRPTADDRKRFKEICRIVSRRAARISAASVAAVVTRIDPRLLERHTVAIDGSVFEKHPHFPFHMKAALKELFGRKASRIRIVLSKDGSGTGAAIIAAVAASRSSRKELL